MKRYTLLAFALVLSMSLFACSGDDGTEGVAGVNGKDGTPQAIKALVLAFDNSPNAQAITLALNATGALPAGSELDFLADTGIPLLSDLTPYDAVIVYVNNSPAVPDTTGDVLADYVDGGGKLVLCQAAFVEGGFAITGRIMTTGYSPMMPTAGAGDGTDKTLDPSTLTFPLHPIFSGVDVAAYTRPGNTGYSIPAIDTDAVVLAQFNGALEAIAVNAAATIVSLNDFPDATRVQMLTCVANAMLWLTGSI